MVQTGHSVKKTMSIALKLTVLSPFTLELKSKYRQITIKSRRIGLMQNIAQHAIFFKRLHSLRQYNIFKFYRRV